MKTRAMPRGPMMTVGGIRWTWNNSNERKKPMSAFKDYAESYQQLANDLGIGAAWIKVYEKKELDAALNIRGFLDQEIIRLRSKPEITDEEDDLIGHLHSMWEIALNVIAYHEAV